MLFLFNNNRVKTIGYRQSLILIVTLLVSFSLLGGLTSTAEAAVVALARKSTRIYSAPNSNGKLLVTLKRVTKVSVLGKRGDWFKIRIYYKKNGRKTYFDGWTLKNRLIRQKPATTTPKTQDDKLLDSLIEKRKSSKAAESYKYRPEGSTSLIHGKLDLGLNLGYRLNSYSIADASESIAYDIPGFYVGPEISYEFLTIEQARTAFGLLAKYDLEFKSYNVELIDDSATPQVISDEKNSGSSHNIDAGLQIIFDLMKKRRSPRIKILSGYILNYSSLSDAILRNLEINLFTDNKYRHLYFGGGLEIPFTLGGIQAGIGAAYKFFLINNFTETGRGGTSPVSGQTVSADKGYELSGGVFWRLTESLVFNLDYIGVKRGATFEGAGSRLTNTNQTINFSDASIDDKIHSAEIGISYDF